MGSELWTGTIGGAACVDGVGGLRVVNSLEGDRGDAEVGVPELALDHDQRPALASHLDGVRVAQPARREASPHAGLPRDAAQLRARRGGRPLALGNPEESRRRLVAASGQRGGGAAVAPNVCNPLSEPYRTASYLIFDIPAGKPDNFRTAMELQPNPYPASGSHQLSAGQRTHVLIYLAAGLDSPYSKANPCKWDNPGQERIMPVSYETITAVTAETERNLFQNVVIGTSMVHCVRIPVTDHCAPSDVALAAFREVVDSAETKSSWLRFDCHRGDGRTTTFLSLYDMVCWKRSSKDPFPGLDVFVRRQGALPPNYSLNLDGCDCTEPPSPPTGPRTRVPGVVTPVGSGFADASRVDGQPPAGHGHITQRHGPARRSRWGRLPGRGSGQPTGLLPSGIVAGCGRIHWLMSSDAAPSVVSARGAQ
jgi:hypothetical protein